MTKTISFRRRIENYLASEKGKRVLNLFYSWGAAFVILGALFKLLHIRFGNEILFVSMMVEFFVFFISGFERPAPTYNWEEVFPELLYTEGMDRAEMEERRVALRTRAKAQQAEVDKAYSGGYSTPPYASEAGTSVSLSGVIPEAELVRLSEGISSLATSAEQLSRIGALAGQMIESYQAMATDYQAMSQHSSTYMEQMESLARNVSGLNTIYEIQLKGISSQIDSIDKINAGLHRIKDLYETSLPDSSTFREENERMATQLRQLNTVYARMLEALTANMGMPGAPHSPYTGQ